MKSFMRKFDTVMMHAVDGAVAGIQRAGFHYAAIQMAAGVIAAIIAFVVMLVAVRGFPWMQAAGAIVFVALGGLMLKFYSETYWKWRNGMEPQAYDLFARMAVINRAAYRARMMHFVALAALLGLNLVVWPDLYEGRGALSRAVLAVFPFLIVQYVMCALPMPRR